MGSCELYIAVTVTSSELLDLALVDPTKSHRVPLCLIDISRYYSNLLQKLLVLTLPQEYIQDPFPFIACEESINSRKLYSR